MKQSNLAKIIDMHIHASFKRKDLQETARENGIDFSTNGLNKELDENNVESALSLTSKKSDITPFEHDDIIRLAKENEKIYGVLGINPGKVDENTVRKIEEGVKIGFIKGLKIYPGYISMYPSDKAYHKFYKLAEKLDIPVIIHTGDVYKKDALVKYAYPLDVDEIAVRFPGTRFVIAHLGNPWAIDAAEVIYKNKNVHGDLSGLCLGFDPSPFTVRRIEEALDYVDDYTKILYGSDWPLVRMKEYIDFIKTIIPKEHHQKVFHDNAKKLFKL